MRSLARHSLLIVATIGAGATLAVTATGHGSRRVPTTFPTTQDQPFAEPRVLASRNGVLATTLTVSPTTYEVAGTRIRGKAYDGAFIGPTMRVRPGDRIELRFRNQLDEATNIHFHGFHVSPAGISDNVLRMIPAHRTVPVVVRIPADMAPGTY
jgi:suppressor of ftsI